MAPSRAQLEGAAALHRGGRSRDKDREERGLPPRDSLRALACRRGYTVAKTLVERRAETGVAWFIIDDLGRMNRDALESLRLGELVEATQVRLIGASDGFDSSNQQSPPVPRSIAAKGPGPMIQLSDFGSS